MKLREINFEANKKILINDSNMELQFKRCNIVLVVTKEGIVVDIKKETEEERENRKQKILGKFSYYKLNERKEDEPFYIFNLYSQFTYFDNERFSLKDFSKGFNDIIKFLLKERKNNGLIKISWVMTENILAVHTSALGQRIGILEDDVMRQVEKKLAHVLAL